MYYRLRGLFGARSEQVVFAVASILALLGFGLSLRAGILADQRAGLLLLIVWGTIAVVLAGVGICVAKLTRCQVELSNTSRDHAKLTAEISALRAETAKQMNGLRKALGATEATSQRVLASQINAERFARYATDMLLAPSEIDAKISKEHWPYGSNNRNTVQKQVSFARAFEESRIRELYLKEIFPDIETVAIPVGVVNEQTGHPNTIDMVYVCAIAALKGAKTIFEFGTYQGRTTYHLAMTSADARVTTLDLPPDPDWAYSKYSGIYYRDKPGAERITQLYEDSRALDTSPMAHQFDFVFVDADHSYDGVKNDTMKAFELLKPGGIVMWHDYAPKSAGLVQFFKELTQVRPLFRIKRTCLLLHIDGVDPLTFEAHPLLPSLELAHQTSDPFQIEQTYHQ